MNRYVFPAVCGLGLIGNVLSLGVLLRTRLRKSSYILLFALTFSDTLALIYPLDFTRLLLYYGSGVASIGWAFSEEGAYALYVINKILEFLTNLGGYCSTTLPVVIMVERCVAVFFPLKFNRLVTAKRAWIVVFCVYLFWLPWCLNAVFFTKFYYLRLSGINVGVPILSSYYLTNLNIIEICNKYFFASLASWVPVCLVVIGAVILGLKIKLSQRQRQKLVSPKTDVMKQSMHRTTRTLVSVSIVFAILYGYGFVTLLAVPIEASNDLLGIILRQSRFSATYLNSGINFVIYVAMNSKFRKSFLESLSWLRMCR
ncbi:unnamed protein product [Lymnaea stagnalis]|uniref:G-protein coupled receptors family 1 profile domain-containing protein n=1 Tax=Lymnaea stagnalis TaxID=6523 RepID=A0AAV2HZL3_LYMST